MSRPEFIALLSGLPAESAWQTWRVHKPKPPLEGVAAQRYFDSI